MALLSAGVAGMIRRQESDRHVRSVLVVLSAKTDQAGPGEPGQGSTDDHRRGPRGLGRRDIMNPGGGPTPDKPDVTLVPPSEPHTVSSFMNLRVAGIEACYAQWSAKGAEFLTPPIDRRAEVRCHLRDPDGYLIEVGQATGMLEGIFARTDTNSE